MAKDMGGQHAKNSSNEARISITVKRNKNAPRFEGLPYKRTIPQTQEGGSTIFSVRARDDDDRVSIVNNVVLISK
jgi:hypothetical protein